MNEHEINTLRIVCSVWSAAHVSMLVANIVGMNFIFFMFPFQFSFSSFQNMIINILRELQSDVSKTKVTKKKNVINIDLYCSTSPSFVLVWLWFWVMRHMIKMYFGGYTRGWISSIFEWIQLTRSNWCLLCTSFQY